MTAPASARAVKACFADSWYASSILPFAFLNISLTNLLTSSCEIFAGDDTGEDASVGGMDDAGGGVMICFSDGKARISSDRTLIMAGFN